MESYPKGKEVEPKKTVMLERVFHRAFTQALFNGRQHLDTRDLLISILSETTTPAAFIMNSKGISRDSIARYLTDNVPEGITTQRKQSKQERILRKYCDNLNQLAGTG